MMIVSLLNPLRGLSWLAVVRSESVADGEGQQWQLFLGLPAAQRGRGATGAGDVGAGVPEERAVRGHAPDTGSRGAVHVQVLHCWAARAAAAFRWSSGDPDITTGMA
jgi:hypothetical protein